MNSVRSPMIKTTLTAHVLLTTDGKPWLGYTFNNLPSGKMPMPDQTQWSHSVVQDESATLAFVGDSRVKEKLVWEPYDSVVCTISWVASTWVTQR